MTLKNPVIKKIIKKNNHVLINRSIKLAKNAFFDDQNLPLDTVNAINVMQKNEFMLKNRKY